MQLGLTDDLYASVDRADEVSGFSTRERLAIEFAERFALAHLEIDDELTGRMRAAFDDAEIVELAGLVAFSLGIGRVYRVLDIANECPVRH